MLRMVRSEASRSECMYSRGIFAVLILMIACQVVSANPIVSVSDSTFLNSGPAIEGPYGPPFGPGIGGQFAMQSWTTSQAFTDVSIAVTLFLWDPSAGPAYHGAAYLTTSVGP